MAAFSFVLRRAYQQGSQLIDRLRLGFDSAATCNGDNLHRFGGSRLLLGYGRCSAGEDPSRGIFRIGGIRLSARSTRSPIRMFDLQHYDRVIAKHTGKARAIGAGSFNASTAQMSKRIRPGEWLQISRRFGSTDMVPRSFLVSLTTAPTCVSRCAS
ncbi:hypothetical protein IAG25_40845 [Caballeronia sp. EK]|nr:hypothetical protein [Caballeronia sp. EK]MBC8643056.1 hypothetical protein [Caballeronia sp. EK]